MSNTMIINMFYIDNKNMTCIKTQNCQIMTTIAYRILKFETTIKKPIVANHTFFTSITVNGISSVAYINFVRQNTVFILSNIQKDSHQDNL